MKFSQYRAILWIKWISDAEITDLIKQLKKKLLSSISSHG